jgi:hypothetical protein
MIVFRERRVPDADEFEFGVPSASGVDVSVGLSAGAFVNPIHYFSQCSIGHDVVEVRRRNIDSARVEVFGESCHRGRPGALLSHRGAPTVPPDCRRLIASPIIALVNTGPCRKLN